MKVKKNLIRTILISVVLLAMVGFVNVCFGANDNGPSGWEMTGTGLLNAISGFLLIGIQQFALVVLAGIHLITGGVTAASGDSTFSISDVVFNKCSLTSANFFPQVWIGEATNNISMVTKNVQTFYVIIRNLSIALLLGILIYIGIRMAISTVASEKAKYQKMFGNWVVSLLLVFVLHYIMILTFFANNTLVQALSEVNTQIIGQNNQFADTEKEIYAQLMARSAVPGSGIPDLIVYGALVIGNLAFALMYLKRTIVLGFLIIIAPLITVTYSIDKIGDGKSQALNTWLKEFIFTVIIQPFHCVIYIVFFNSAIAALIGDGSFLNMGAYLYAIASILFMLKAENVVKKIFGIQANDMGNIVGTGAMALSMATGLFKGGNSKKIDESKGKMPNMTKGKKNAQNTATTGTNARRNMAESTGDGAQGGNAGNTGNTQGTNQTGGNTTGGTPTGTSSTNTGSTGTNSTSTASSATNSAETSGNDSMPITPGTNNQSANTNPILNALSKVGGFGKRYWDYRGGMKGAISGGATLAGLIAGAAVGDAKSAVSVGTAAGGVAKGEYEKVKYKRSERQLEANQKVFMDSYNDFAQSYRNEHEGASDNEIRSELKRIYDTGGQGLKDAREEKIYNEMDDLATSAEIMGYSNGFSYVNETMRLAGESNSNDYDYEFIDADLDSGDINLTYEELENAVRNEENGRNIEEEIRNSYEGMKKAEEYYGSDYNDVIKSATYISKRTLNDKNEYADLLNVMEKYHGNDEHKKTILDRKKYLDNKYGFGKKE